MDYAASLKEHFGFAEFRPGQRDVIEALDRTGAALAVFPTGGGKSLCYQLPGLTYDGVTVVVSPLIALMKDQIDFLTRRGIAAARLDSSLAAAEAREINDRLQNGQLKLLYVAPERFNNERFLAVLARVPIALFAVDEAHCISEWGHNFRPDYLKLAETARALGAQRVLALTATATPKVVDDICASFQIPHDCAIVTGFYRPNLEIVITPSKAADRDGLLVKRLTERPAGPTIVYVTLQKEAERVASVLAETGLKAWAYHAGLETDERTSVQERWMAASDAIVVATIAFGMGIDKVDVRYVYHYNLPKSLENYSQEIGRAGRDDKASVVEALACPGDIPPLENFAYGDTPTQKAVRGLLREVFNGPPEFDVSLIDLSNRYDIRQLVVRTLMTYLELGGWIKQGTPFYAGYEVRPVMPIDEIFRQFKGEAADFTRAVFASAKKGRIWYALNPDGVAERLGQERRRIVRCLEYLEEHGWAEVRAADLRQRYTRTNPGRISAADAQGLLAELMGRMEARERQEIDRIQQVLGWMTLGECLTNALARHFGEDRRQDCGHCSYCKTKKAAKLPPTERRSTIPDDFPTGDVAALRSEHPDALGECRQTARFLCGLTSPTSTRARLGRHPLFGTLQEVPFPIVLEWCDGMA